MQMKSESLRNTASNADKIRTTRANTSQIKAVRLGEQHIEVVDKFTYLGTIINLTGGTDDDVKARITKHR